MNQGTKIALSVGAGAIVLIAALLLIERARLESAGPHTSSGAVAQRAPANDAAAKEIAAREPDFLPIDKIVSGSCTALAPPGWTITDTLANGTGISFASPDARESAVYASTGYPLADRFVGDQYASPAAFTVSFVKQNFGDDMRPGPSLPVVGGYSVIAFSGNSRRGFALFRAFQNANQVAIVMRAAAVDSTSDARALGRAGAVATSVRCTQQLAPPPASAESQGLPTGHPAATATSPTCQVWSPNCDDSDFAGAYNTQIGTGYVHDNEGRNFEVDPDKDRVDDGPDGPGYYKHIGDDLVKLSPGRDEN